MTDAIHAIRTLSSMATRHVLDELAESFQRHFPYRLEVESVGGVVAARRVQADEVFDVVVLAADVIDRLGDTGKVAATQRIDVARSGIAVAIRKGAPRPDIRSEAALRRTVAAARSISYSTGPSGMHLQRLFERWGIAGQIEDRIVEAPPGVPVGSLVANGSAEIGFQQMSELIHLEGIDLIGPLPAEVQIVTVFSAALATTSVRTGAARQWLAFLASPEMDEVKLRHGMLPGERDRA
jgi:molybdate transport system substrate-binding protein